MWSFNLFNFNIAQYTNYSMCKRKSCYDMLMKHSTVFHASAQWILCWLQFGKGLGPVFIAPSIVFMGIYYFVFLFEIIIYISGFFLRYPKREVSESENMPVVKIILWNWVTFSISHLTIIILIIKSQLNHYHSPSLTLVRVS